MRAARVAILLLVVWADTGPAQESPDGPDPSCDASAVADEALAETVLREVEKDLNWRLNAELRPSGPIRLDVEALREALAASELIRSDETVLEGWDGPQGTAAEAIRGNPLVAPPVNPEAGRWVKDDGVYVRVRGVSVEGDKLRVEVSYLYTRKLRIKNRPDLGAAEFDLLLERRVNDYEVVGKELGPPS